MEYAKDCQKMERPWKMWELRNAGSTEIWVDLESHPKWKPNARYRRKPRTITIPESELPEPMREGPKEGSRYYFLNLVISEILEQKWDGCKVDIARLSTGLCYHTEQDARAWLDWWRENVVGRGMKCERRTLMQYVVNWIERCPRWASVEAESEDEAIQKAKRGEVIDGTQDGEPGDADLRTYRIQS